MRARHSSSRGQKNLRGGYIPSMAVAPTLSVPASSGHGRPDGAAGQWPVEWLVRAGFFARGFVYAVIGALALALAAGAGSLGTAPDQQGALALLSGGWLGSLALISIAVSLLAYALWKLWLAVAGKGPEGGGGRSVKDRAANLAGGVVYVAFFLVAVHVLTGGSRAVSGHSNEPRQAAAGVLSWPGGQVIVAIAGAVMIAICAYQLYDALRAGFAEDSKIERMGAAARRAYVWLGRIGITARALAFGLVGYFVVRAAIDFTARKAVGLDGALARVHNQAYGPWLLGLVAAGLLVFAVFSCAEGRYRRL